MKNKSFTLSLAALLSILFIVKADAVDNPLAKTWNGNLVFLEQPEQIGNPGDFMHFISMFWDSDPIDTPGSPHFKSYYIGDGGGGTITTKLARSFDGINFTDAGQVLPAGAPGEFDDVMAAFSSVWKEDSTYYMVYEGAGTSPGDVGLATSSDGVSFTKQGAILTHAPGTFESANIGTPSLYNEDDTWYMYYHGFDGTDVQTGLATGTDLVTDLTRVSSTPIIPTSGAGWDSGTVGKRSRITKEGNYYYMAYEGSTDQNPTFGEASWNSGMARSSDLINWETMSTNPVLRGNDNGFGYDGPEMVTIDDELYIYYRKGPNQTYRAKAVSPDDPNIQRVINFGFETEFGDGEVFADWGYNTGGIKAVDNGPSIAGTTAASITTAGLAGGHKQFVSKAVPIESGELLNLSFDFKTLAGAAGNPIIQVRYYDGVGTNGYSDGGGGTNLGEFRFTLDTTGDSWDTHYVTGLPNPNPAATHFDIWVIENAFSIFDGTALFDNFILEKSPSKVLNFGMETDYSHGGGEIIEDWGFISGSGVTKVDDNGPSALGSTAASVTTTGLAGGTKQFVSKAVSIDPGEILDLSFDYKTLAGANGELKVQLRYWDGVGGNGFSDGGGGSLLGSHTVTLDTTNDEWLTSITAAMVNPNPAATHVDLWVIQNAFEIFDGTALFDNFMLSTNLNGDFDQNGVANGTDFLAWQRGFGSAYNEVHLAQWEANFGSPPPVAAATAVPEPSTLVLVFFALVGCSSLPRMKKLS